MKDRTAFAVYCLQPWHVALRSVHAVLPGNGKKGEIPLRLTIKGGKYLREKQLSAQGQAASNDLDA